ncbi:MAG: MFS transporter [Actinomycetota bacterium]|nr:MFS transporter [Actinomycetota bacterium]
MFADPDVAGAGLSPAAISVLFILWSACSFLFEIPTGILADRVPRRRLLVIGPVLTAAGFALWTWWPSFASFATGFVLWSAGSALRSGTMQALIYDTLSARGHAARYASVSGRLRAFGAAGVLLGTASAVPLAAWAGYHAAGAASVVACLVCAAASWSLPEDAPPGGGASEGDHSHGGPATEADAVWAVPAVAIRAVCADRALCGLFLLVIALTWVSALDEYLPLLADEIWPAGMWGWEPASGVAVLMVVVAVGDIAGGWAARRTRVEVLTARRTAPWLIIGAVALAVGSGSAHPAGIVLVACAFAIFGWAYVMTEALMQQRVSADVRATTSSVVGVGEEVVAVAAFGSWALGSGWLSPSVLFALAALPYAVLGVVLAGGVGATTARASARYPKSTE